ncbi:MAG: P-loop NTPase [Oscillospiraceae bacterium]
MSRKDDAVAELVHGQLLYFQESFFRLRTAVEQAPVSDHSKQGRVLLVTSVTEGEGKSTVASNLAMALAKKYRAVMLIDADLRNPTQIRLWAAKPWGKRAGSSAAGDRPGENRVMQASGVR